MFNNHTYNLMNQLVQEHKALWRIQNNYIEDAEGCAECVEFWKKMTADKKEHVAEMMALIKDHLE